MAELSKREKIEAVFRKYDHDSDGYLSIPELRELLQNRSINDLPRGFTHSVMKNSDKNSDKRLDFDEFYRLATKNEFLFKNKCVKMIGRVVPDRRGLTSLEAETSPFYDEVKFCPPPLAMLTISLIEIIFFVIDQNYPTQTPCFNNFIYNPNKRSQVWRFVTYMFVHVGMRHLFSNLLIQLVLGTLLELVNKWWRVVLVYLAGVLAGSLGTSIVNPNAYLAGASGGVYALITAHIAIVILNWKEMQPYAPFQMMFFALYCFTDIGFSIYNHLTDDTDKVGYTAHICGATAGLLVGIGVLFNLKELVWERKLWWCAVTIYVMLMGAGIFYHIYEPSHFKA